MSWYCVVYKKKLNYYTVINKIWHHKFTSELKPTPSTLRT